MPRRKVQRREKGSGRVYEYPKSSGKWWAQLPERDGKTGRKWRVPDQETGENELAAELDNLDRGYDVNDGTMTVSDNVTYYIDYIAAGDDAKFTTLEGYNQKNRLYIAPTKLGKRPLVRIRLPDYRQWKADLDRVISKRTGKKLAANTKRNTWRLLSAAHQAAYEESRISWPPPSLNFASDNREEKRALSEEECNTLLEILNDSWYFLLFKLAIATGMRESELVGLQWSMFDREHRVIHLTSQLQWSRDNKCWRRDTLKSRQKRDIFISQDLVAELVEWEVVLRGHQAKPGKQGKHGNQRNTHDRDGEAWNLIFPSKTAGPITATNLLRCLDSEAVVSKIGSVTVHNLRHTAGSLMLRHGHTMTTVSKVLGHSSVEVTSRIYAHAYEDDKRDAVTVVSTQLRKRSPKEKK